MGKCPDCGNRIGPVALFLSWDNFGKFKCSGCGTRIQFKGWFLTVLILIGAFTGAERLLHWMLISEFPLGMSFFVSFLLGGLIMLLVPMIWSFKIVDQIN